MVTGLASPVESEKVLSYVHGKKKPRVSLYYIMKWELHVGACFKENSSLHKMTCFSRFTSLFLLLHTSFSFHHNLSLQKTLFITAHFRSSLHILCITARYNKPCYIY